MFALVFLLPAAIRRSPERARAVTERRARVPVDANRFDTPPDESQPESLRGSRPEGQRAGARSPAAGGARARARAALARLVASLLLGAICASHPGIAFAEPPPADASDTTAPPSPLGCVDLSSLRTRDTPAELYPAVRACIQEGHFARGVRLFALAGVYGRFDTLRVVDVSAHAVIPALRRLVFSQLDDSLMAEFQRAGQALSPGSAALGELCADIRKRGPPAYEPVYMRQHGLGAITGTSGGPPSGFDPAAAWESSLTGYLSCPQPASGDRSERP